MPIGRESIRRSVRAPSLGTPDNVPGVAELIPRKILFGNPDRGSPEVAPDGRRLAHLAPVDDVLNVWVGDLDGERRPAGHERHRPRDPLVQLGRGRPPPRSTSRTPAATRTGACTSSTPRRGADRDATPFDGVQARVLGVSRRHPGHMLIGLNKDQPGAARRLPARAGDRQARARGREPRLLRLARRQRASPARRDAHARRRIGDVRARRRDPPRARRRRRDVEPGDRVHGRRRRALHHHPRRVERRRPRARSRPARRPRRSPTTRPTTSPRPSSTRSPAPSRS